MILNKEAVEKELKRLQDEYKFEVKRVKEADDQFLITHACDKCYMSYDASSAYDCCMQKVKDYYKPRIKHFKNQLKEIANELESQSNEASN